MLSFPGPVRDEALWDVVEELSRDDLGYIVGNALRKSFDEVIDGPRTGRYSIGQLEKTEKTYIGTKVEIVLRDELQLDRGRLLDNLIAGHEVDTKFSLSGKWMFPREAVDQLCLVVSGSDVSRRFRVGVVRASPGLLAAGANQDKKRQLSSFGREQVQWLAEGDMPANFIDQLDPNVRDIILGSRSGKKAIAQLFRHAQGRPIPRSVIEQVARQKDPLKRAREAKAILATEGIRVLCATYSNDRVEFLRRGVVLFNDDDWMSVPA